MRHHPPLGYLALSLVTLGIYPFYYYITRTEQILLRLDALNVSIAEQILSLDALNVNRTEEILRRLNALAGNLDAVAEKLEVDY